MATKYSLISRLLFSVVMLQASLLVSCQHEIATMTSNTNTTTPVLSQYQLIYHLIDNFGDVFWCDPDYYPVAREGQEQLNALEQYPAIRADTTEFAAILSRLNLTMKTDYSDPEKLAIYREHKKLTRMVQLTASGSNYDFELRVGKGQGWRYVGTITTNGEISVKTKETSMNTCPICLAKGTVIDTPGGPIPVEQLQPGMLVWSLDLEGGRIATSINQITSNQVPDGFRLTRITLADGRSLNASPMHPTAEGKSLGSYLAGDILDGSLVSNIEFIDYDQGYTFDILPDSPTYCYWANGVLLKSSLSMLVTSAT
jgi:hypothetical protein